MPTITVKDLKEILEDKPEDMPVGLWDMSTDDFYDGNYPITKEDFLIEDYVQEEGGEPKGKMLFITFENKLNENSINNEENTASE